MYNTTMLFNLILYKIHNMKNKYLQLKFEMIYLQTINKLKVELREFSTLT